ncbi:Uncharacterised protein [Streptococcus pneumoniae]|nr:Uncharacterised protein [Streptococcus pneumoniae]CIV96228.1 Uncharacterised protein [Streptococcus pneumoniae]
MTRLKSKSTSSLTSSALSKTLRARLDTTSKRSDLTANSVGSKTKRAVNIIDVKLEVMANPASLETAGCKSKRLRSSP